ncbi:hypothetical protein Dsin_012611 [Dipteronia sinensis]|uniref:DUF1985 domain-containing protein n=1 Tax=Dipteronia sinensis TaxID=43782 RepID=A0AAE0AIK7_9ROSI|nr:hypothetical protein Dsin_012611 [Dipteronia sinensis]
MVKFSQREFCFVTGLQFRVMLDIFLKLYAATQDGIHVRYFENDENIPITDVWARFLAGGFDQPKDCLKMALVLIANNVLFGQDLRRKVTLWLFQMVENLEAFNSFPWGSYVSMMTIHYLRPGFRSANAPLKHIVHYNLYGFLSTLEELHPTDEEKSQPYFVGVDTDLSEGPQFVPLNVELDDGEQQLDDYVDEDGNDDGNDSSNDSGNDGGQSRPQQKKQKSVKMKVPPQKQKMAARTKKQRISPETSLGIDDSTDSSRIMREVTSAMSDRFQDIVKKEIKKKFSAMEDRLNACLNCVEASLAELVNQRRQTTPEVHNFSTPVHQHFEVQGDYVGSPNVRGDGTIRKGVGEGDATLTKVLDGGDGTVGKGVVGGNGSNWIMISVQQSIPKKLPVQLDNDSCGVFICRYTDMLMHHKCFWGWGTKNVPGFREEMAQEIFANSVASD